MKWIVTILFLAYPGWADITPAQWLATQPKPNFAPGNHFPKLSKYGWPLPWDLEVECASNWNYALQVYPSPSFLGSAVTNDLNNPASNLAKGVALCSNFPSVFTLCIFTERSYPTNLSDGYWVTNSSGQFVDDNTNFYTPTISNRVYAIVSPAAPNADLQIQAASIVQPLAAIGAVAPIGVLLNGGERDLGVSGFDRNAWKYDPRVLAGGVFTNGYDYFTNNTGMGWYRYSSLAKSNQLAILTAAIDIAVPAHGLYIFYNTGSEQSRYKMSGYDWDNTWAWAWSSDYLNAALKVPSFEDYFLGGSSWTNAVGTQWSNVIDLLTKHLDGMGYNIARGYPTNYTWVTGGYAITDINKLADINRYKGFLKCLYTAGTVGANAGYYSYPISQSVSPLLGGPGFDASFPANTPPHWLMQIVALSQVHAEFTWLENYTWNGSLLPGNGNMISGVHSNHFTSLDQPSYEFTNTVADAACRVLARKLDASNNWLVCAWAADGPDRNVTVNIPTLGSVTVYARDEGSVYKMTQTSREWVDGPPPTVNATFGTFTIKQ